MDRSDLRLLVPRRIRRVPADLVVVVALVFLTAVVVLAGRGFWTLARWGIGFCFLFFLPGYAVIAALFPESAGSDEDSSDGIIPRRIDGVERFVLSTAASLAVVPLIGYLVSYSPWGLDVVPALVSIGGFTVGCAIVAAIRRRSVPESERFSVPFGAFYETVSTGRTWTRPLNLVLVVSLVVASAGIVYTTTTPRPDERFTELYIGTKNGTGETVADAYPRNFTAGESQSLRVGIGNHEYERTNYTVVVLLQRVNGNEGARGGSHVTAQRQLDRFHVSVAGGKTAVENRSISPTMTGERLRLQFLLYRGAPPASPTPKNAYRRTHLWINVTG
ncbi:DUF1616 domain-containing protein [Haladaptatus sp. AB618]|uniref:DUF1616 domain-containing protein n=1 Tax=Haladaptatus sp. AB618 TaxID=2934173 RepID=UPI00209C4401|nr:DUF1616 domain-containing protein [Haladaptatus sp. AB618]MCO8256351.1 DUF1616 domain-containing protein [Haladaptatus sp. AB618]